MKWIDRVFNYSAAVGLSVIMDLHSAPGGQSGNQNTGCYMGAENHYFFAGNQWNPYFNTRNLELGVQAIERMAEICASAGATCAGIELLNEPCCAWGTGQFPRGEREDWSTVRAPRDDLSLFYKWAITAARRHMSSDTPIFIMDWTEWIDTFWKPRARSLFQDAGNIVFSSHIYEMTPPTYDLQSAQDAYSIDLGLVLDFKRQTGFDVVITEWTLGGHGGANSSDHFPYADFTRWLVRQFDRLGGSMIWNFDSYFSAWGPVDNEPSSGIPWKSINSGGTASPGLGAGTSLQEAGNQITSLEPAGNQTSLQPVGNPGDRSTVLYS